MSESEATTTVNRMFKLLGVALIVGGLLVASVITWLMWWYVAEELLAGQTAVIGAGVGLLLFVLPQWILGVYLLWPNSRQK